MMSDIVAQWMPTSLAEPQWLAALVLPALIAGWVIYGRRPAIAVPFDFGTQRQGVWLGRLLRSVSLLPALLLTVAIFALAGPQRLGQPGEARELTNMEFIVDVSGSMSTALGEGTRFDGSIAAIDRFTTHRRGDAFGLTIFGDEVLHWTPLTKDVVAIRAAAPFIEPDKMPSHFGGTEIGKAVRASLARVRSRGEGNGVLILVSDGESADLYGGAARQIGSELATQGIVLYAVHIGDDSVPTDLYDLATPGGGRVFAARDEAALATVFARIDELQPVKLRPTAAKPIDAFELPAIFGLALVGLYQVSLFGLRYTPW
jgi:Ca-activated chloride channel family protein